MSDQDTDHANIPCQSLYAGGDCGPNPTTTTTVAKEPPHEMAFTGAAEIGGTVFLGTCVIAIGIIFARAKKRSF